MLQIAGGIILAGIPFALIYCELAVVAQGQRDDAVGFGWGIVLAAAVCAGGILYFAAK